MSGIRKLTVILDKEYSDGDCGVGMIIRAIEMIKGVAEVEKGPVVGFEERMARLDYRTNLGCLIAELVMCPDAEYLAAVRAAYELLKARRGF